MHKEKNKVGILTFYHRNYNFGGLLQAYALPKVLKDQFNLDAEQIKYSLFTENKGNPIHQNIHSKLYNFIYRTGIYFFSKM